MDEPWRQENTTGKQCAGLGRGRLKGTWLGKSGLSPCPGMTTVVTEGNTGPWNTGGPGGSVVLEEHWAQNQGPAFSSCYCFQQLCDIDQGHLPFLYPLCAHLRTPSSPGCQNVPDAWWTLNWQLGVGGREREPNLSDFTLLKGTDTEPKQKTVRDPVSAGSRDNSVGLCGHPPPRQPPT